MFGFPISEKPEGLRFASNALQAATFQLKYQAIDFSDRKEEIVELVKELLPQSKGILRQQLIVSTQNDIHTFSAEGPALQAGLAFRTESEDLSLTVRDDEMTLVIAGASYTYFQEAFSYVEKTLYKIADLLNITLFNRVAIRKVNAIGTRKPEQGKHRLEKIIQDVFSDALISPLVSLPQSANLDTFITNCYFIDSYNNLNLVYGLLPKQEQIEDRQMLLDIDIFHVRDDISLEESKQLFLEINNETFNVFMWSLKPAIIALLQQ